MLARRKAASLVREGVACCEFQRRDCSEEQAEQAGRAVQAEVDKVLDEIGEPRPGSVTVRVGFGSVVQEMVNASKDADMLVVGSRGAGGFARLLLGSVSSLVAQHATCPWSSFR